MTSEESIFANPLPKVKAGCVDVDDSLVMDDAHKHYSKHRPMEEVKVILPVA